MSAPFTNKQVNRLFQNGDSWAIACMQFTGLINNNFPTDISLQYVQM